jgi:hypothetical protein
LPFGVERSGPDHLLIRIIEVDGVPIDILGPEGHDHEEIRHAVRSLS